jgi:ribonucleoside-diphosphate reductase alpha chain
VAALAFAIQQILHRRGFLDAEGNQVPSRMLARLPRGQMKAETALSADFGLRPPPADASAEADVLAQPGGAQGLHTMLGRKCGSCGANAVIRKDGCDFCTACGEVGACG